MSRELIYDPEVNAGYVEVRPGTHARTTSHADCVFIDWDADGKVLGVEILFPPASPYPTGDPNA